MNARLLCVMAAVLGIPFAAYTQASRPPLELVVQEGHAAAVTDLDYCAASQLLLSGSADGTVKLWNLQGKMLRTFRGGPVSVVRFLHGGERFAAASLDGTVTLWDSLGGRLWTHAMKEGDYALSVDCLAVSPDGGLIAANKGHDVVLLDPAGNVVRKEGLYTLSVWNSLVTALAFSPDGATLACAYGDGSIRLWDVGSGSARTLKGHEASVTCIAWDPDGARLLSGDEGGRVIEWSADGAVRASRAELEGKEGRSIVSVLPMGREKGWWAFAADGTTLLHDAGAGGNTIARFGSPTLPVGRAIGKGEFIAFSTFSNIVAVPDVNDPSNLVFFPGHEYAFHAVEAAVAASGFAASALGTRVMVFDGSFRRGALLGASEMTNAALGLSMPSHIAFHPRVNAIVTNDARGQAWLSRTDGRKTVPTKADISLFGTTDPLLFTPQGASVIGVDIFGNLRTTDLETGRTSVLARLGGADDEPPDCAALATGAGFAGAYPTGKIIRRAWDGGSMSMDARIPGLIAGKYYFLRGMGLDPSGSRLASVDLLGFLKIWDQGGSCTATRQTFSAPVISRPDRFTEKDQEAAAALYWSAQGWSPTRCVSFSPDGRTLATGSWDGAVRLWSRDGELLAEYSDNRSAVQDLCFSRDGGLLFFVAGDARIEIVNLRGGERATLLCTSADWLLYTPDGYWDSSVQGGKLLAMVQGTRAWNIDQFAAATNRPDIILERLGCADAELLAHYRAQHQRRLRRLGLEEKDLGREPADAPQALITGARQEGRVLELDVGLSSPSSDLRSWNLWVNDVPLFGATGRPVSGRSAALHERIELTPGASKVEVGCTNLRGLDAFRGVRYARWEGAVDRRLYYLGFGVSRYARVSSLDFAAKDARDLADLFRSMKGGGFTDVVARTWTDGEVSARGIREAKALLKDARPQDTLVLFVAGHGVHDADAASTYYFLPTDADVRDLAGTAASFDLLEDILQGVPPRGKLFLLDTCESGEDAGSVAGGQPSEGQRAVSRSIRVTKVEDAQASPASVRDALAYRDRFIYNDVFRRSGAIVLSSCRGDEVSWEAEEIQNGAFTSVLKASFSDPKADADGDGALSVDELKAYVSRRVPELVSSLVPWASQHPTVDRDNISIRFGFPRPASGR